MALDSAPLALITGGAKRLGAGIARYLHQQGYDLIIHFNQSEVAAKTLAKELNGIRNNSVGLVTANLLDPRSLQALVDEIGNQHSQLHLLVNNASTFFPTPVNKVTDCQWDSLVTTNAKAPFMLTQGLLPLLQRGNGCVINMVDIHAAKPFRDHTVYCIAKAALVALTKSLAVELAPQVRVNGIAPGAILWPETMQSTEQAARLKAIPLGRSGTLLEIAEAVYFLARANYITGQILAVDGGASLS
ncbi:pteridine reductase [Neiella marina]|uniref:Pteridine reductase n=1 Tax=Neiella holothuriorum TaxID=2870530 RepID=A0ABS7EGQ9_9GAMM|nr:pteridine reductase [Neiella holothuriorum]MBW8191539.1 pteridine reductase [Neiella holothuriorum]